MTGVVFNIQVRLTFVTVFMTEDHTFHPSKPLLLPYNIGPFYVK